VMKNSKTNYKAHRNLATYFSVDPRIFSSTTEPICDRISAFNCKSEQNITPTMHSFSAFTMTSYLAS